MSLSGLDAAETVGQRSEGTVSSLQAGSWPRYRQTHWQYLDDAGQLLVVNGSQVFAVDRDIVDSLDAAAPLGDAAVERCSGPRRQAPPHIDDEPLVEPPPIHALSLAVAQKCNLGCTYCYASRARSAAKPKNMAPADRANPCSRSADVEAGRRRSTWRSSAASRWPTGRVCAGDGARGSSWRAVAASR